MIKYQQIKQFSCSIFTFYLLPKLQTLIITKQSHILFVMQKLLLLCFVVFSTAFTTIFAQNSDSIPVMSRSEYYGTTTIGNNIVKIMVINGDTIPVADFPVIDVVAQRVFVSADDRRRYFQWRTHAVKVYPYAAEAVQLYRKIDAETKNMSNSKRKKYVKKLEKEVKPRYEEELKKLTKTQGYILIKMVERELNMPFYNVLSQLRGDWEAFKWQSFGVWYGYNLKQGYDPNKDPLLESILLDLNISYLENINK